MKPQHARRILGSILCAAIALAPGCGTTGPSPSSGGQPGGGGHEVSPRIIDLSARTPGFVAGGDPGGLVSVVPTGSTLFFRNPDPREFLQLRIAGDFTVCRECVTVTGFTCLPEAAVSRPLEPGGVASLCFHTPGRFELRVSGAATLSGHLEVRRP